MSVLVVCLLATALSLAAAPTASARAGASVAAKGEVLLPQGSRFVCEMVDEGPSSQEAWVYCWEYVGRDSVGRHVRLDPDGEVSLSATEPRPTGLGGPGQPYGAWVTVGRFRCEVLVQGVECVVVATGKGFLAKANEIVEVQTPPGVSEPAPVLGQSVNVEAVSGGFTVRRPGSKFAFPLNTGVRIPVGTVVDTTRGTVRLSSASAEGATQTALFHGGLFRVGQPRARSISKGAPEDLTVLTLVGSLPKQCRRARASSLGRSPAERGKAGGRHLWGNGYGHFQTGGRYGSATVSGTKWLVSDSCAGTLVKVARGVVTVEDFVHHTTATVIAGHSYFAHPGPSQPPSSNGTSHALIWRALGGKVICGVVAHAESAPATSVLCSSKSVPPPPGTSNEEGDPGFVYLERTGRAHPTRVSQYSWIPENGWLPQNQTALGPGAEWSYGKIGISCKITSSRVSCSNRSGHGFTLTGNSYKGF